MQDSRGGDFQGQFPSCVETGSRSKKSQAPTVGSVAGDLLQMLVALLDHQAANDRERREADEAREIRRRQAEEAKETRR